ncbi:MAG: hypothetical protein IJU33_02405 [Bacteroidales bacterium]|nr:hypothetical protein [Bacteroidales bacterium]
MIHANPLSEVFGFPTDNKSQKSKYYRDNQLCPFNNRFPNCTKDKADNPLGVCSIFHDEQRVITCPSRFREDWIILNNAAAFLWPKGTKWTALPEIKLTDAEGQSAGNIDYVLISYDEKGQITDFASIEVQGVYISGNLRNPFQQFIEKPSTNFNWEGKNFPHPDYLSSSRKRLVPQMLYKGGIFKSWNKKQCVVIQDTFFDTLPKLPQTTKENADIAWFLYALEYKQGEHQCHLTLKKTIFTEFDAALKKVIYSKPGKVDDFVSTLQHKLDEHLINEPETHSAFELL